MHDESTLACFNIFYSIENSVSYFLSVNKNSLCKKMRVCLIIWMIKVGGYKVCLPWYFNLEF